jgi:outer membrane biosynthesis protein TonB
VQQMWRAMHRPQGTELSTYMRAAVRDFLEQFPEGITMSSSSLAIRYGMLPAIVKAIRTANDAKLENDKKETAAAEAASKKSGSKEPNKDYKIWKTTGSAVLITEAKPAEPTTPVHQTRSGDIPPTPTAPKKPKSKKPEPKKKPDPKKKPEPKKPKSAKPTGIQKATPPTTPTGGRKSARLIANDLRCALVKPKN